MIERKDLYIRDPFVYFEDGIYYLYGSRNDNAPIPQFVCYRSRDLEHFEEPKVLFKWQKGFWADRDYWAPEMHKYQGKYYLLGSLKSLDRCRATQIFVSDRPDGDFLPLSDGPITPINWECLDGTLYVENETPYLVFCREWLEVEDGEMYAMPLSQDLTHAIGQPTRLFSASEATWTIPFSEGKNYVTDGPFIVKQNGVLQMIWSSFGKKGYAVGLCESPSILGPWKQLAKPIYEENGGHAMVFSKNGQLTMSLHSPNTPSGNERVVFMPFPLVHVPLS